MGLYYKKNRVSGINFLPRLTLSEYNNLQNKPKYWIRTDAPSGYLATDADSVSFDDSDVSFSANSVQGAIEVLDENINDNDLTEGGTISGNLNVDNPSQSTSRGTAQITVGNNKPTGTTGNAIGVLALYGEGNKAGLITSGNLTQDRVTYLPDADGTIALESTGCISKQIFVSSDNTTNSCSVALRPQGVYLLTVGGIGGSGSILNNPSIYLLWIDNISNNSVNYVALKTGVYTLSNVTYSSTTEKYNMTFSGYVRISLSELTHF